MTQLLFEMLGKVLLGLSALRAPDGLDTYNYQDFGKLWLWQKIQLLVRLHNYPFAPCGAPTAAADFAVYGLLRWRRFESLSFELSVRYCLFSGSSLQVLTILKMRHVMILKMINAIILDTYNYQEFGKLWLWQKVQLLLRLHNDPYAPCGAPTAAADFVAYGLLRWRRFENASFAVSFRYFSARPDLQIHWKWIKNQLNNE